MKPSIFAIASSILAACALAQDNHWYNQLVSVYQARQVPPVDFSNSPRLEYFIRAGILYLSLHDAVALAIENNLDVEFERFAQRVVTLLLVPPPIAGYPGLRTTPKAQVGS